MLKSAGFEISERRSYFVKKYILMMFIIVCALAAVLSGCGDSRRTETSAAAEDETQGSPSPEKETETGEDNDREEENMDRKMIVEVNGNRFTATLENNEAVDTLFEMMQENPIIIQMRDYSGFEKVGNLGTDLRESNRQTTTQAGDIVLYQGNQIVIFYGSNSWSYTRLGRIEDLTGWENALGDGDVTVTFSLEE